MNRGIPATFSELISRLHEISMDIDALNIDKPERICRSCPSRLNDEIDWTPAVAVNCTELYTKPRRTDSETPREAQWVSQDELDRRRTEGKYLRYGKSGHFIADCKLLPA